MELFASIAGGVALILFGVRFLRKGLDRLFGPRLAQSMQRLTSSRWRAMLTGLGVSLAAPSSTTVSIMAVQAVQAGHLSAKRMLAVIFGANIGLTVMVLLIAMRLERWAPALILVGVILYQFTRRSRSRGIGQVVLSLGLIFLALDLIKSAAASFDPGGDFVAILSIANDYPVWLAVIAAILTVAMQSSTAAIALVIGLGVAEAVGLSVAVAVVVGANVGLSLSMLIVGWGEAESRRVALGNLLAKLAVAVAVLASLQWLLPLLERVPLGLDHLTALAHTGFNVVLAAVFLPLVEPLYALTRAIVPEPRDGQVKFGPQHITQSPVGGLALATGQSMREILRVSDLVRAMLADLWRALETRDQDLAREVQDRDDEVDLLDAAIKRFLTELAQREGDQDEAGEILRQLRYLTELETIGDVIDKNLAELAIKRVRERVEFSATGWAELRSFYEKVAENLLIAETAFTTRDQSLAQQLLRHKEKLSAVERDLRDRHFARLRSGERLSHESSAVHLDLLTHLKRINNHVSHVAFTIINPQERHSPAWTASAAARD